MAGRQVKAKSIPSRSMQEQPEQMIFALDIGTRSIIGMVGTIEENKIKIVAIESEEHTERAMIDGQIEDIEKVTALVRKVKARLEERLGVSLTRVCVAAAGRALRTKRADYELIFPSAQLIDDEIISRLEGGAISKAEAAFDADTEAEDDFRRFYLVGYTVCQYYLDKYMISSLRDHRGKQIKADLIATFLPSEVVDSLYTTMHKAGLEVASITLEPIAAINAAIPANLRLLNLVLVDIGAGTSDIAVCTDGSVTGYTMATVAGDEVTETLMKEYLVDFQTAERMKAEADSVEEITFTDILGFEQVISRRELLLCIQKTSELLCKEIAEKVLEINGSSPSALFLAGGGSKLTGLKDGVTNALQMDAKRVAIVGNNFHANACSAEYDLNNPEYATPLGIAISYGLNLINDSFRVMLNGKPAKLFRSGSFTALNLLMMNGYNFQDIMGRRGSNLFVMVNGKRKLFYGTAAQPSSLVINKKEGKLSDIIHAGDYIEFVPAVQGTPARAYLGDIEGALESTDITLNGEMVDLETLLKNGDVITMTLPEPVPGEEVSESGTVFTEVSEFGAASPEEELHEEQEVPDVSMEEPGENGLSEELSTSEEKETRETSGGFSDTKTEKISRAEPSTEDAKEITSISTAVKPELPASSEQSVSRPVSQPAASERSVSPTVFQPTSLERSVSPEVSQPASLKQEDTEPVPVAQGGGILFQLNGSPLLLPSKADGQPYYLMDMIQYSGIDLKNPKGKIALSVNGEAGMFQQALKAGDKISIVEE